DDVLCTHPLVGRKISGRACPQIRLINVEVFITALVLRIEDMLTICLPVEKVNVTLLFASDRAVVVLAYCAHPYVEHPTARGQIGEHFPIRGNLWSQLFGIAEQNLTRYQFRQTR